MKTVIVQIVQHLRPGGIETMALELQKKIEGKADIYIFSLEGDFHTSQTHWPRLSPLSEQLKFFNKPSGISLKLIFQIKKALQEVKATAIHTHHIGPLLYGGIAARLLGLPHVHTEHDSWHLASKTNRYIQSSLISLLRPKLVADCSAVADDLVHLFPGSTPSVIPNGIDTQHFLPASSSEKKDARRMLNLPQEATIVGCAARLESVKGHEFLIRAISKTRPDIHLALAGEGTLLSALKKQVTDLGLENRIYFLGHLDDPLPFYHAIDIFCLPSLNEGLPLSPLEAQSCDIPAIVSSVGGCQSIVCPKSGDLVQPGSESSLQHAILRQHFLPAKRSPRAFVLTHGDLDKTADSYYRLLSTAKGGI